MNEESLLAAEATPNEESAVEGEAPAVDAAAEGATEATPWFMSEDVAGEGDAPEWFKSGKFKSVAAQAEAYKNLESKLGGFTGAPDEYESTMPDGMEGEFIEDDPLMGGFQDWAKENQLSQEAYTGLLHMYLKNEAETNGVNRETELGLLGAKAEQRLQNISDFGKANLSDEDYAGLLRATTTAESTAAIEALISMTRAPKIPTDDTDVAVGVTHAELKERQADPRYKSDPAFRKETTKLYEQLFGNAPKKTVVG